MGKVVMYASVSVDGFIADENDQPGPLFDRGEREAWRPRQDLNLRPAA